MPLQCAHIPRVLMGGMGNPARCGSLPAVSLPLQFVRSVGYYCPQSDNIVFTFFHDDFPLMSASRRLES